MEINKIISQIKELATSTHNYALLANYIITNTQKVITFRINWIGYNKLDHNYIDFKIIKKEGI